ncbi:MAG TPA: Gfo/Idh/MocA family oxidoreductase, partial [Propionibacteriaceae bacterium]|nr:Gfo/Idh/MocA family oxidoreductase [Propionibacteriaceae bacterium]
AVPHCYSAYAMVRHAARLVREGELGAIRFVAAEHASGWNASPLELTGHKQAVWRTDPEIAGRASVVGDLGTHAYHLVRYITGLDAERVSARMDTLVQGRRVFDNATITTRLTGDVPATIWASMAATGHNHGLRIRVFGDQGNLEWQHEDPHHLKLQDLAGETRILAQGMSTLSDDADRLTRVGLGHPEGFLEAFANFYRDLADELQARRDGSPTPMRELSFPTGEDGLLGVQFVEAVSRSHSRGGAWTVIPASENDDYYVVAPQEAE